MPQAVIENPVINSPFTEPLQHFCFTDEGITDKVEPGRRKSSYFIPIAQPRKKGLRQLQFDTEWTQDCIEVTGQKKKDKAAKVATARTLWVPAVNNHGGLGRWNFIEIADPWDTQNRLRSFLGATR